MTAILGYSDGVQVWIGSDSLAIDGNSWDRLVITERKVFKLSDDLLIGIAGNWSVCQVLQTFLHEYNLVTQAGLDDYHYLCHKLIPALQKCLKDHETLMIVDNHPTGLTIGYRGKLYQMDSYFSLNQPRERIVCDGSGGAVARGAFAALMAYETPLDIPATMLCALRISARYNLSVADPFYVLSVGGDT